MIAKSPVFPIYGSFTLHGAGTGTGKRWVSVLRYVLYTLHRDRDRYKETLLSIVPIPFLSRSQGRSHAMSLSHKCTVYVYILAFFGVDVGDLAIACILISISAKISICISASRNSQLTVSLLLYAACSSAMTNCATCSSATACTTCDSGYYETSGSPDTCNRE